VPPPLIAWRTSDARLDTAFAHHAFFFDPIRYDNTDGMPMLLSLTVTNITCPQPRPGGGYSFDYHPAPAPFKAWANQAQAAFVEYYYPAFYQEWGSAETAWWSLRRLLARRDPAQLVGSYVSGTRCQDAPPPEEFPPALVDCCDIDPSDPTAEGHEVLSPWKDMPERLPEFVLRRIWDVNPADPKIGKYRALILREAAKRNPDFMFIDNMMNVGYPGARVSEPAYINPVIDHVRQLCSGLNGLGYRALFNTGKFPDEIAGDPEVWKQLTEALGTNGIYMEVPFRWLDKSATTNLAMTKMCELLAQGCLVVLSPPNYSEPGGVMWTAAMAMVMRDPGQALFVSTDPYYNATANPWRTWPADFGPPADPYIFTQDNDHEWHVNRPLANMEVTVVHLYVSWKPGMKPVRRSLPVPTTDFNPPGSGTILPRVGKWYPKTNTYVVGAPSAPSDRFILFSRDAAAFPRPKVLAVQVTFHPAP
jgi:hypothetical protein